jgi:ATP phosphoribosyltransferase regulatory subunit
LAKPEVFEKPAGVRDYLPEAVAKLRSIEFRVLECMRRWGYSEIRTPTLEYYDTVGAASSTSDSKLFKLLDRNGTTLVMRSDVTAPIARVVASLLKDRPLPIRLSYHANVFRAMEEEAGRDAEFYQTGVELVGDATADADAEVVALAIASLSAAGVRRFKIALGHVGFLNGFFREMLNDRPQAQTALKERLLARDHAGYRQEIADLMLDPAIRNKLGDLLRLRGGEEIFAQARLLTFDPLAGEALAHLREVWEVLKAYGASERVMLDLTMIGDFSYYTGMTFEGYADGHGFPVASGGRYDNLLMQFGRPAPATGFALKTNRILEVTDREPPEAPRRILVAYCAERREEALRRAGELRAQLSGAVMVETRRCDRPDVGAPTAAADADGFDEVIEFF